MGRLAATTAGVSTLIGMGFGGQVKYRVFPREISEKVDENKADDEKSPQEKVLLGVAELRSRAAECS